MTGLINKIPQSIIVTLEPEQVTGIMYGIKKRWPKAVVAWRLDDTMRLNEPTDAYFKLTVNEIDQNLNMLIGGGDVVYTTHLNLTLPVLFVMDEPVADLAQP